MDVPGNTSLLKSSSSRYRSKTVPVLPVFKYRPNSPSSTTPFFAVALAGVVLIRMPRTTATLVISIVNARLNRMGFPSSRIRGTVSHRYAGRRQRGVAKIRFLTELAEPDRRLASSTGRAGRQADLDHHTAACPRH